MTFSHWILIGGAALALPALASEPMTDAAMDQVHIQGGNVLSVFGSPAAGAADVQVDASSAETPPVAIVMTGDDHQHRRSHDASPRDPALSQAVDWTRGAAGNTHIRMADGSGQGTQSNSDGQQLNIDSGLQIQEVTVRDAADLSGNIRGNYSLHDISIVNSVRISSRP